MVGKELNQRIEKKVNPDSCNFLLQKYFTITLYQSLFWLPL